MRRFKANLGALAVALVLAPSAAFAQTLEFVNCPGTGFTSVASPYMESGFQLFVTSTGGPTDNGFGAWCTDSQNYAGESNLFINVPASQAGLMSLTGAPFSVQSIDLAHLYGVNGPYGPESFTFTGQTADGRTVTQTFTIGEQDTANPSFSTFVFNPDFTNLNVLTFAAQNQHGYQFTDLVLNSPSQTTVPEPASLALFGTGLVIMGAVARRRFV